MQAMPQKSLAGAVYKLPSCVNDMRLAVKKMFWAITVLRERQSLEKRSEEKRTTKDERSVCDLKMA